MSTRVNGWHRLWVLVTAVWVLWSILQTSVMWTPSTTVRKDEVYRMLLPEQGEMIADFEEVMARQQAHPEDVRPLGFLSTERATNLGPVLQVERHRVQLISGVTAMQIDTRSGLHIPVRWPWHSSRNADA